MNFFHYNQELSAIAANSNFISERLSNGALVFQRGKGKGICILSGLHGDERGGPMGIRDWMARFDFQTFSQLSFLIMPLVNDSGWDRSERLWKRRDLNRSFGKRSTILTEEIKKKICAFRPNIFLDFHEDEVRENYFYRLTNTEGLLYDCLEGLEKLGERKWFLSESWEGSSEVFVRKNGCEDAVTIELSAQKKEKERRFLAGEILDCLTKKLA